jgi:hypothetical protein
MSMTSLLVLRAKLKVTMEQSYTKRDPVEYLEAPRALNTDII